MKKITLLLAFIFLIFACSSEDSSPNNEDTEFPINITLSSQIVNTGDILTIGGNGFSISENYIVTFTGDVTGNINEITPTSLKVEVPEDAISGDITLSFNSVTQVIGSLTIEDNTSTENVYLYYESQGFIVKLDIETGGLEVTRDGIASGGETIGAVYNHQTNEYIVFFNNIDPNYIRINLTTGEPTFHAIDPSFSLISGDGSDVFSAPVIDNNGNVYLFYQSGGFLVELNIETGDLEVNNQFASGGESIGSVYNQQTNEYIVFFNNTDPNYIRVNLTTGDLSFHAIDPSFSLISGDGSDVFSAPVIDNNGNVYLFYQSGGFLVELNIETGDLEVNNQFANGGETVGAVYNQQTNEYIAFFNNTDPNYVRVNLTTLELNFEAIDPSFSLIPGDGSDVFSAPVITTN